MRVKLVIVTFIILNTLALVPLGFLAFASNRMAQTPLTINAKETLFAKAVQTVVSTDTFVKTNLVAIHTESQLPVFVTYLDLSPDQRPNPSQQKEVTSTLQVLRLKDEKFISSYALLDRQGLNVIDTHTANIGQDESKFSYFQQPLQTGLPYVSAIEFSKTTNEGILHFSSPVKNSQGEVIGVLRVRYSPAILQQLILLNSGTKDYGVLLDEEYMYLAHAVAPEMIFKSADSPEFKQIVVDGNVPPFLTTVDDLVTGETKDVAVVNLETRPWLVVHFQSQEELEARSKAVTNMIFLVVTVLAVLIIPGAIAGAVFIGVLAQKSNF
jgi:hypothetical protein